MASLAMSINVACVKALDGSELRLPGAVGYPIVVGVGVCVVKSGALLSFLFFVRSLQLSGQATQI